MVTRRSIRLSLIALIMGMSTTIAFSGEAPIARMHIAAGQVAFETEGGNGWVNLRVTGPGEYAFTASFPPGQLPIFRALDPDGNPLPDGTYNYEIEETLTKGKVRGDDDLHGLPEKSVGKPKLFETQFGVFTVLNGSIVDPSLEESSTKGSSARNVTTNAAVPDSGVTLMDQVIPDDLIVQSSLCVGFDCVNGESFGFDTIRLKENNTRIKFEDTSAGSFPSTDWQLTANDSANGGQNKFSIEDISGARVPFTVEGGATNNSLYVDSTGRIGFRTSTPVLDLHAATSNTPGLRLEQNSSGGFTAQTWDIAGNEANFFVRDVTGGSRLPFRIRPGAATSSIDIASSGNVGMGTASPGASLHVQRTDGTTSLLVDENSASAAVRTLATLENNGDPRMFFTDTSDGQSWQIGPAGGGFAITLAGSGVTEFRVDGLGNVTLANDLNVGGNLTKSSGSFKIDHPLDPANKYLYHSFVESPDMLNIYNGNVVLDENGESWVDMPEWFESLNQEFRYQLTALVEAAPGLYVANGIEENRFRIAGGTPGGEVSWQVTGVRHDPYAVANRIKVEEEKALADKGTYIFPGYLENSTPRVTEVSKDEPGLVIAEKNAEIHELRLENQDLKQQLNHILYRLTALEASVNEPFEIGTQAGSASGRSSRK